MSWKPVFLRKTGILKLFASICKRRYKALKLLIIDNYDSFTYNLLHYLQQLVDDVQVARNDEISLEECSAFTHFVISPGPGLPQQAGITMPLIRHFAPTHPILGICLGMQALAEYSGAKLYNQQLVAHGIQRLVQRLPVDSWLLKDLPPQFLVGLYHSWAVEEKTLDYNWLVTARNERGTLMAMEHKSLPLAGVQFHPESIMSEYGLQLFQNWLAKKDHIH